MIYYPGLLELFGDFPKKLNNEVSRVSWPQFISIAPPFTCSTVERKRRNFFRRGSSCSSWDMGYIIRTFENFSRFSENSKKSRRDGHHCRRLSVVPGVYLEYHREEAREDLPPRFLLRVWIYYPGLRELRELIALVGKLKKSVASNFRENRRRLSE
jgi:hypothetical protein